MEQNISITDHALDQYIARIKHAADKYELAELRGKYETKYREEITRLFLSSELYYTGFLGTSNKTPVEVYINKDGWVLLADTQGKTIITIYRPDLGVDDEEFNRQYVLKSISKINKIKDKYEDVKKEIITEKSDISDKISELESKINEYTALVNGFKKQIEGYKTQLQGINSSVNEYLIEYRTVVENFCAKDKIK